MNFFQAMQIGSLALNVINTVENERDSGAKKKAAAIAIILEAPMIAADYLEMSEADKKKAKKEIGKIIDGAVGFLNLTVWKK